MVSATHEFSDLLREAASFPKSLFGGEIQKFPSRNRAVDFKPKISGQVGRHSQVFMLDMAAQLFRAGIQMLEFVGGD